MRAFKNYFGTGGGNVDTWEWLCMHAGLDPKTASASDLRAALGKELSDNDIVDDDEFEERATRKLERSPSPIDKKRVG